MTSEESKRLELAKELCRRACDDGYESGVDGVASGTVSSFEEWWIIATGGDDNLDPPFRRADAY